MKINISLENRMSTSLAIKAVEIALEKAQKTYKTKHKKLHFSEDKEIDLLQKKFKVIIGDDRPNLGAFGLDIKLRIRIVSNGSLITEAVDQIQLYLDDEKPIEGQDSLVMKCVKDHIETMVGFVAKACDNV